VKRVVTTYILPWTITAAALAYAFYGIDWLGLVTHLSHARGGWILLAVLATSLSYLLRARRWQTLFPDSSLTYTTSLQVLVLGFFMNNVLPARAGELVRAHKGAQQTGTSRALVLATIASERLADGLTLSIFFVIFSLNLGNFYYFAQLLYVACAFAVVSLSVVALLLFQAPCRQFLSRIAEKFEIKFVHYLLTKSSSFLDGLAPLSAWPSSLFIAGWSIVIWLVELSVFFAVAASYNSNLSISLCVLFMVTVNFSSLIPAAPGGLGVIEAVATAVLVSCGIPREQALTMVITQHSIQFLVIGIGGSIASTRLHSKSASEQKVSKTEPSDEKKSSQ
jgi:glycosyltransferase 2 family protein